MICAPNLLTRREIEYLQNFIDAFYPIGADYVVDADKLDVISAKLNGMSVCEDYAAVMNEFQPSQPVDCGPMPILDQLIDGIWNDAKALADAYRIDWFTYAREFEPYPDDGVYP